MKKLLLCVPFFLLVTFAFSQDRIAYWNFDRIDEGWTKEQVSGRPDSVEGYYTVIKGVKGNAVGLDGFTTRIQSKKYEKFKMPDLNFCPREFTVEAWIELGNYPWNWCPVVTVESDEVKGYRLMVGPYGQVSLDVAVAAKWESVTSCSKAVPLRKWTHIAATYKENDRIELYIDGKQVNSRKITGKIDYPNTSRYTIGMVAHEEKPSDLIGAAGSVAQYFGLDGAIDELEIRSCAVTPEELESSFAKVEVPVSDIAERKLPTVHNPREFGAFYTTLEYYPGWDKVWPVSEDADVVVCFEKSPVKMMFWRGIRYEASWVDEKENWMTDQSVEAWNDSEGCYEHMQDRHCRFSHVRVIENNPARVVVHWRYAPVSAYDHTWRKDPKTDWEVWVDEYYYIYPDASAVRRVSWKKGSLGEPRQFQESLALLQPGQNVRDLVEMDYCHVADYNGKMDVQQYMEHPTKPRRDNDYTIQQYNFKSENRPFIFFEEGNDMTVTGNGSTAGYNGEAAGCNHFPVAQARSHGRIACINDRPRHILGFPISYPPVHEDNDGDRHYWAGVYGMNGMDMDGLINFGRSWMYAPEMAVSSENMQNNGYDRSRKCYDITDLSAKPLRTDIRLEASEKSPLVNPAFIIRNWNGEEPEILIDGKSSKNVRTGINRELAGRDLVIFIFHESHVPVTVNIRP